MLVPHENPTYQPAKISPIFLSCPKPHSASGFWKQIQNKEHNGTATNDEHNDSDEPRIHEEYDDTDEPTIY